MPTDDDLYAILGVLPDADAATIKKAYRELARALHPDTVGGDSDRFARVAAAYEVLSDPGRRADYDQVRLNRGRGRAFHGSGAFRQPFGYTAWASGPRRGDDLVWQVTVSFRDAFFGTTVTVPHPAGPRPVRIPAGVRDEGKVRARGLGLPGVDGGPAGDLLVTVQVMPHRLFGRDGDNLTLTLPVTFDEAALGANVAVPTMSGFPVTLKVPPRTPTGRTFRIRGRGAPRSGVPGEHGDLLVTLTPTTPPTLNDRAARAMAEYRAAGSHPDVRAGMYEEGDQP